MAASEATIKRTSTAATGWAPTAKVSVGVLAAAVVTLITSVFWKEASGPQAAALTTLITFVIQYLVPERT